LQPQLKQQQRLQIWPHGEDNLSGLSPRINCGAHWLIPKGRCIWEIKKLVLPIGIEPTAPSLPRTCSTPELRQLIKPDTGYQLSDCSPVENLFSGFVAGLFEEIRHSGGSRNPGPPGEPLWLWMPALSWHDVEGDFLASDTCYLTTG
jgi:hypothetical protein